MSTAPLLTEDLLEPIAPDQPGGVDLRWTPEWDRIKEARRADDGLESGKWAKKERKTADWVAIETLAAATLKHRSKDLQLALWLTEAKMKLRGFPGLRDGLRTTCDLMLRYWDQGLYPSMEDGPEDRAGPFEWLNNKLTDCIAAIPITTRGDGGQDYSFNDLVDARLVGSQASWTRPDGEVDDAKKKAYEAALAAGRITLDLFEGAVKATRRAAYEDFSTHFRETFDVFKSLERAVDDKFGDAAPNLSGCRTALNEIRQEVEKILEKKRAEEPDLPAEDVPRTASAGEAGDPVIVGFALSELSGPTEGAGSAWEEAQALLRSGQVDRGLARMVHLSARETTGRNRFQRRLLLAEACLATRRQRLARSILEELAEQIDKLQLEAWESSEMISSVWTRLYRLYKQGGDSVDLEKAQKLYERLCRLDPWQALACGEG